MALLENNNRSRNALPSINHLELDKVKADKGEYNKFASVHGLNLSTTSMGSPTTLYSGPPPPYSSASPTVGTLHGLSGYISPPESTTRRSTRDEKESPSTMKSLPSIQEALGEKTMMPAPPPTSHSLPQGQTSNTGIGQSFPDAPRGPLNPFSQPAGPTSTPKEPSFSLPPARSSLHNDPTTSNTGPIHESKQSVSHSYTYPASPRASFSAAPPASTVSYPNHTSQPEIPPIRSPRAENSRSGYPFPNWPPPVPRTHSLSTGSFQFESGTRNDETKNPFTRSAPSAPYGETVKRHLDIYDAELALNEIHEASTRTLDFSRYWGQRYHQSNRSSMFTDGMPALSELDDMMRQSQRITENLNRVREVVMMQQAALSEERARTARGVHLSDEYNGLSDDYKLGGFAGGDAKKRRGKAAPPGRCHSCNRAETPEWRRGPDGARTLCNACGLHYAKLTRKIGANKASALTGSSLRPKNLDPRS